MTEKLAFLSLEYSLFEKRYFHKKTRNGHNFNALLLYVTHSVTRSLLNPSCESYVILQFVVVVVVVVVFLSRARVVEEKV